MKTARCRYCNVEIAWCETPGGKKIPLDIEPGFAGRYLYSEGQDGSAFARLVFPDEANHGDRRRAHFSTCAARRKVKT